jgi:glutathione S-transferase
MNERMSPITTNGDFRRRWHEWIKGLSFESIPIGFTEIPEVFGGRFKTVPVICHGHAMLAESWDIAEYLDRAFSSQPPIFSGPAECAMVRLMDAWFSAEVLRRMFRVYVFDVHNAARPEDRPYFSGAARGFSRAGRSKSLRLTAHSICPHCEKH